MELVLNGNSYENIYAVLSDSFQQNLINSVNMYTFFSTFNTLAH